MSSKDPRDYRINPLWGVKLSFYMQNTWDFGMNIITAFCVHLTLHKSFAATLILVVPITLSLQMIPEFVIPALLKNPDTTLLKASMAVPLIPLLTRFNFPLNRVFLKNHYWGVRVTGVGRFANLLIGSGLQESLKMTIPEVAAFVGHELGHWVLNHMVYQNILLAVINISHAVLFRFFIRNQALYRSFDIDIAPEGKVPVAVQRSLLLKSR
jgi:hypothetical protein